MTESTNPQADPPGDSGHAGLSGPPAGTDHPTPPTPPTRPGPPTGPGRQQAALRTALRAPFSRWAWESTIHVMVGFPVAVAAFVLVVTLGVTTLGLAITAVLAIPTLFLLLGSVRVLTAIQRSRFEAVLGIHIPEIRREYHERTWLRRLLAEARDRATWRQIAYHLLSFLVNTVSFVVVANAWAGALVLITAFAHGWQLPPDNGLFGLDMHSPVTLSVLTVLGVVLLFGAPWIARGAAEVDVALARAHFGPSRSDLSHRVRTLAQSRAGVVDAADAERRRIERDLHDGTQQRLVSLAMNLGMARARLTDVPEPAREAIASAHEEAKQALTELRDFVRGLHPAVLNDRGLDAALSGVAARTPLPVSLGVDVPQRPSPTIEAVAYFVVSEALANVAKHARATRAEVSVNRVGDRLRVIIADDGQGGVDPSGGSGLRGLAHRVASVDGTLDIESPVGGPTLIVVELPCES